MSDSIHILIDADSLYFRICCTTKKKNEIRRGIRLKLKEIEHDCQMFFEDVHLHIAVKGAGNFRFSVADDYKGVRPDLDPDLKEALNYGNQYLIDEYGAVAADGAEADDLVAIWAQECWQHGLNYIVSHIDKDLNMIPGPHHNFHKQELYDVSPEQGYKYFMLQCLTGDRADHIQGIRGIGPKKAEKALEGLPPDRWWSKVKDMWQDNTGVIRAARLLWMSANHEDVVTANKTIIDRLEAGYDKFWESI